MATSTKRFKTRIEAPIDLPTLPKPAINRGYEISMKGDIDKIPTIGVEDLDSAIQYHFDNILRPTVVQNNKQVTVPVIYGSPERWKAVQVDGFYRDRDGKIQVPLIMYRRTQIAQNRTLGNKLDGNSAKNVILLEKKFSSRNIYDNYYLANRNLAPHKEWMVAVVPDYVTVTYECTLFTDYVDQMNKLVEAINFASNSYWGDPERFRFLCRIDTFSNQVLLEQEQDRAVKTDFSLILNGYLIPDTVNAEAAKIASKLHNVTKIVFYPEIVKTI
jgi:hypothetical protein